MSIPKNLTTADVEKALKSLSTERSPLQVGPHRSRKYDLIWGGRLFPPKVVVSKAVAIKTGKPFPTSRFSGGIASGQANRALESLGFTLLPKAKQPTQLPLLLHARFPRRTVFASRGMEFSQQNRNQTQGLSPRCPDGGYFIFITMNKEGFEPAHDYEDEIYSDSFVWVTRRGVKETDDDYVQLRNATTRVSLFVRNVSSEDFAYLGEVGYGTHTSFVDEPAQKPQQSYLWSLQHLVPDELLNDLTFGIKKRRKKTQKIKQGERSRRPANFDEYKKAYSYVLDTADRTIIPAHHNYQVHLSRILNKREVPCEFENAFVDVAFTLNGSKFIGEIKVTTTLKLNHAFRLALGQLLEYSHLKYDSRPQMVMFLDQELDGERLALATTLQISVVIWEKNRYRLLNPSVAPALRQVFA